MAFKSRIAFRALGRAKWFAVRRCRWQTAGSRQQAADSRQQAADSRQQAADRGLSSENYELRTANCPQGSAATATAPTGSVPVSDLIAKVSAPELMV